MSSPGHESGPTTAGELEGFSYGRGFFELQSVNNPAAGAEASVQLPGAFVSRLITCVFTLATSAVVANRVVTLEYQDGNGAAFLRVGAAVAVTAGSTQEFSAHQHGGSGAWNTGTPVFFGLPDVFLEPGRMLVIDVDGIDVGDQLSGIVLGWERFPTGPRGYEIGRVGRGGRQAQHTRASHVARHR